MASQSSPRVAASAAKLLSSGRAQPRSVAQVMMQARIFIAVTSGAYFSGKANT
jgi:hypothetical protein